jgi:hypothetical protein
LFQTFAAKVEGKLENIWPLRNMEHLFWQLFYIQNKGQSIITLSYKKPKQKIKIIAKYIFQPVFYSFLPNFVILQPPVHEDFFGAFFELFGRKLGHLATVLSSRFVLRIRKSGARYCPFFCVGLNGSVADPSDFLPDPDTTFENVRNRILTLLNVWYKFLMEIFFYQKYALKSTFMNPDPTKKVRVRQHPNPDPQHCWMCDVGATPSD